ncbi:unnamed protein product [Pleuronectes platessa]|uniref:Interleukin n=1 Tax=Pleuronectes platessa TaxID=8262 RepID=A0A9N7Y5Y0_PLEPL|nr:unnamed protein product [Pleuronectes platessa]
MEHFIGISFWIATLFICLQAKNIPLEDSSIPLMRRYITCEDPESRFYAPTDVKAECMATALECIEIELKGTVKEECTGKMEYLEQAVEFFEIKRKEKCPAPTTPAACECERWPQESFGKFLDKVESLLQQDASAAAQ